MNAEYRGNLKSMGRNSWLWLTAWFITMGAVFFGIYNVAYNLYVVRLGFGTRQVGILLSIHTIVLAAVSLPAGILGTRIPVRSQMITALGVLCFGLLALILVPLLPVGSRFIALAGCQTVQGSGLALLITSAVPLYTSFTTQANRALSFSLMSAVEPLGAFAGGVAGGYLPRFFARITGETLDGIGPYRWTLALCVVLLIAAGLSVFQTQTVFEADQPAEESGRNGPDVPRRRRFGIPIALLLVLCVVAATRTQATFYPRWFFNIYVEDTFGGDVSAIGRAMSLAQLAVIPLILAIPLLFRLFGKERCFVLGMKVSVIGAVILGSVPRFAPAALGLLFTNVGFGMSNTVYNQYSQEVVPPFVRSLTMGAVILTQSMGGAGMNLAGGHLVPLIGYRPTFLIAAATGVAAAVVFGAYFRSSRRIGGN